MRAEKMQKNNSDKIGFEKKFFSHSESATSTVIGAVLLLGIISSALTIVYVGCVPEWKNDAEYSHMGDVCEDMAEVKSKIDMMSIILASNPDSSYSNSLNPSSSAPQLIMSVPFNMGGGDLPLVGPIKSSGTLAVNKDNCKIGIVATVVTPNGSTSRSQLINCGTITYNSQNNYYVDQAFSYENGAIILNQNQVPDQEDQSVMMLYPSIRISKALDDNSTVTKYNFIINNVRVFQPYVPPKVISSNRGCSLRLIGINYRDYRSLYEINETVGENLMKLELTVWTEHPTAWEQYFKKITKDANIDSLDYDLECPPEVPFVRLTFPQTNTKGLKGLYVSETVIKAEPGIGLN
jgi:hypothetical protein